MVHFKDLLAKVTLSLFLILLIHFSTSVVKAETNLLANPGFETGNLSGWAATSNTTYGVATDGTVFATDFGPDTVEVRTGTYAAYTITAHANNIGTTISQTIAVEPNTVYDFGYYFVNGNTAAFNPKEMLVNGQPVFVKGPESPVGTDPSDFKRAVGSYFTGPSETSITVSFKLLGSGTGKTLFSYDDFFAYKDTTVPTWPDGANLQVTYVPKGFDGFTPFLLLDWTEAVDNDGVVTKYKIYGDGELLQTIEPSGSSLYTSAGIQPVPLVGTIKVEACDVGDRCTTTDPSASVVLPPEVVVKILIATVQSSNVSGSQGMVEVLQQALANLQAGNNNQAIHLLEAFIRQVEAAVKGGRLTEAEGQKLINAALGVIADLNS